MTFLSTSRLREAIRRAGPIVGSPLGILGALVVTGLVVGALTLMVSGSERGSAPGGTSVDDRDDDAGQDGTEDPEARAKKHVNRKGRYSFRYPRGWRLTSRRATTEVRSPDHVALVSLGRGPSGNLMKAAATFMRSIQQPYHRVQVQAAEVKRIQSYPAFLVSGTAVNKADVEIRFLAITIEGGRNGNYAIAVFTAANSDPAEVLPPVEQIIDSFRPLPRA